MSEESLITSLESELKTKNICRFCLSQQIDKLGSIYRRDGRLKSSAPLPVQVMACASIEVFSNDGMPSKVCCDCRLLFEHAYRFKQMCKRAETLLKQFPLTGKWPIPLAKPKFPKELLSNMTAAAQQEKTPTAAVNNSQQQKNVEVSAPIKILNTNPADSPEPPVPMRMKREKLDEETTNFLNKVENNEELSMDDVQRLIAAADEEQVEFVENESNIVQQNTQPTQTATKSKPKLLNKSSIRILNKDAEIVLEPRLSAPQLKRDVDGKMAMVTEILDPDTPYEQHEPVQPVANVTAVESIVFPCPHCERSFPLRQLRDIHMVNHTRNRSFQCAECDKSFFSKYDLQKHILIHTGDRPFKCTVCEKGFTRATLLHRHEKTHTDIPKFICIYCEKPFLSKEQMEKHAERHQKNRPYNCGVCNKSFAFKQGLERHEGVHSREQPYPCQYCDLSFSTPSKLARHLTAHAGQRPYPCKFCPKSYLLSHHLTRHLRSHKNGTVSFMCSDCDKVFKTRDELIYHSAVHATQTLVCPLCKDIFDDIQSVTVHIKEHAEGDAYACEFCDLIFMTSERLQEHTDSDHARDMAAYQKDDQEKLQRQQRNDGKNSDGEGLRIIEEFLEEDEISNDHHVVISDHGMFKQENDWATQISDQPQILNEIVLQSKFNTSNEENFMNPNENSIVVASKVVDADEYVAPPSKIRKVATSTTQKISKAAIERRKPQQIVDISPQIRRKVAQADQMPLPIKIEKIDIIAEKSSPKADTSINTVLKMLPKGVSVRRNPSSTENNVAAEKPKISPPKQTPQQRGTRNTTRVSNESGGGGESNVTKKVTPNKSTPSNTGQKIIVKNFTSSNAAASPRNSQISSTQQKTPVEIQRTPVGILKSPVGTQKTVKMMLGDKKVKVQKITITKAEAAAMAKDGRIRMKDGNMVLTKAPK